MRESREKGLKAGARRNRLQRQADLEVANLPPPWKRSISEGHNPPKPTRSDQIIVAVTFSLIVAFVLIYFLITGGVPFVTRSTGLN